MDSELAVSTSAPYLDYPNLQPGDRIAVEVDGYLEAHVITELSRKSGMLIFGPDLTRWQRIRRALTPPRWRGPLPAYHRAPDTVEIRSVPVREARLHGLIKNMVDVFPADGSPSPNPAPAGDGESHQK